MSKVATVEYLKSYFDEDIRLHNIYRYMAGSTPASGRKCSA